MSSDKSTAVHDPFKDIVQQQEALDIAIKQHANESDIVESLRKQKAALGDYAKQLRETQDNAPDQDGGNISGSQAVNAGNKSFAVGGKEHLTYHNPGSVRATDEEKK
jgi:hypothetical protein